MNQRPHIPALTQLFETLTETEQRILMFRVSARAGFELPGSTASPAQFAFKAAELVANHEALDADLLRALLELRPRKRAEIQSLADAAELPLPRPVAPSKSAPAHGRAAALYAVLSAALLAALLVGAPERLPSYKLAVVAVSVALMAGLVSMLLTGQALVRVTPNSRPWHIVAEASGGLAVVLFILTWWPQAALQEPAPPDPSPSPEVAGSGPHAQGATIEMRPEPRAVGGATADSPALNKPTDRKSASFKEKPPRLPTSVLRWTVAQVSGRQLKLAGDALPQIGRLRLVVPDDDRKFVSPVECRIEEAPMTCMLIALPGNAAPRIGDSLELVPPEHP